MTIDVTADPLATLAEVLRALDVEHLAGLERSLEAIAAGDHTVPCHPVLLPHLADEADPRVRELLDLCNVMVQRTTTAMHAVEELRGQLTRALGDRSCLTALQDGLQSLNDNCLTDLDSGLQAMADGDMTRAARPKTHPLRADPGDALGEVGELFNEMLARSRTALRSYDAVREDLRTALGDRSCVDDLGHGLRSLQRHCLRDLEEALEALAEGTALTRPIAPVTEPIATPDGAEAGELALLFNRALARARVAVQHLDVVRQDHPTP